ncbi:hypothetical protein [uncultured Wocania sp.]|uniref:hypothetical protein n=1 Tax=uncultured Wocania sp. TaxID=2834404 RepID=UPI0030F9618A
MFKYLFIKKLCVFIFVVIITLISCDGRDRKYKTNTEVLKENKLFDSFSEEIKYIPEQRTEVLTDTFLSTGFQIKIQYYALDTKTVKFSNDKNKTLHFKNFEAQLQILKNNKLVVQNIINKRSFIEFESPTFWEQAIMQFIWIDYEKSTENIITLNTSFNIPETEIYKDFSIIIDAFGNIKIREISLVENVL